MNHLTVFLAALAASTSTSLHDTRLPSPCRPCPLFPQYAVNHLTVFLAVLATSLDFTRHRSAKSGDTIYLPTLYPGDSVFELRWRKKDM